MKFVISSIGMICALGHDVATACSAMRAGLSRARPIEHFNTFDEEEHETSPLTGHPIRGITDGFCSVGRWLQMARYAFENLVKFGKLPGADDRGFWQRTAAMVVAPSPAQPRFHYDELFDPDKVDDTYLRPLFAAIGHAELIDRHDFVPLGSPGVVLALKKSAMMFKHGIADRVMILGADSLLDAASLEWLEGEHRLKGMDSAAGLVPGEAGVALLVESTSAAERRRAEVVADIVGFGVEVEDEADDDGAPIRGRAMARAVSSALSHASPGASFRGGLVVDLNGEEWRALEYGAARSQLVQQLSEECGLMHPAASIGDCGAAAGMMGIGWAAWALQRDCLRTDEVLITSSSENGIVGAVMLRKHG